MLNSKKKPLRNKEKSEQKSQKDIENPEVVAKNLEKLSKDSDAIRQFYREKLKEKQKIIQKNIEKSNKVFQKFVPSTISLKKRIGMDNYLQPNDNLENTSKKIIDKELAKQNDPNNNYKIHVTEKQLKQSGFEINSQGIVTGTGNTTQLLSKLKNSSTGNEFYVQNPLDNCMAEQQCEDLIEKALTSENTSTADSPTSTCDDVADESLDVDEFKNKKLSELTKHITSPEHNVKFDLSGSSCTESVKNNLADLKLPLGPADVPSYHDFYNLRLAFDNIWTEIFDDELIGAGKQLYEEFVQFEDFASVDNPETISTVEEFRRFEDDIKKFIERNSEIDDRRSAVVAILPTVTRKVWKYLDEYTKSALISVLMTATSLDVAREEMKSILDSATQSKSRLENLLEDIENRLNDDFAFKIFAPNSINFGVLLNYKQKWTPLNYQVGELVSTIPLAPKETRKYTTKMIAKKSKTENEITSSSQSSKFDSASKSSADKAITKSAHDKTSVSANIGGGFNIGVPVDAVQVGANASISSGIVTNSAKDSASTKKTFKENVKKSAQEYKNDHKTEIKIQTKEQFEETTSAEITNTNDEITVTYLFYELQRRYEINEKLHKISPVILVANEIPAPHKIDSPWLLSHKWLLEKVLLDDQFRPALNYLTDSFVSRELSLLTLRGNMEMQAKVVQKITEQISVKKLVISQALNDVNLRAKFYADEITRTNSGDSTDIAKGVAAGAALGTLNPVGGPLVGGIIGGAAGYYFGDDEDQDELDDESARLREQHAKETFQRLQDEAEQLRGQLQNELTTLSDATDKYVSEMKIHFQQQLAIDALRIHIKQNILYYMQSIWAHESFQQRFLRLCDLEIPVEFNIETIPGSSTEVEGSLPGSSSDKIIIGVQATSEIIAKKRTLSELTNFNLLGFFGNYMIFPLNSDHSITDFMVQDYIKGNSVEDPDILGNYTTQEILDLIRCRYQNNPTEFTDEVKKEFKDLLKQSIESSSDNQIIVPTGSLYIDTLPGSHSNLEPFKKKHRAIDVKKAQADVRTKEIENIRNVIRILKGDLNDPDIEKQIVISGNKVMPVVDVSGDVT